MGLTLRGTKGSALTHDEGDANFTSFQDTSVVTNGDALIGVRLDAANAVATTQHQVNEEWVTVFRFMSASQIADVTAKTFLLDVTTACQAALTAYDTVVFPDGGYKLSTNVLSMDSNQLVIIRSGAELRQTTADVGVFKAVLKDNCHVINDGLLYGPGVWSSGWTGNGGHEERGVQFLGCTRSSVTGVGTIRNFGHAGLASFGGTAITFKQKIEGTNGYGSSLTLNDNFQMGVYIADDTTYGSPKEIDSDCNISGTAQGVVYEHPVSTTDNAGSVRIRGHIHDIPGQHAIYFQNGNIDFDITVKDIALSACKIQSPLSGQNIKNFKCNVVGSGLGSHVFELATLDTGSVSNLKMTCQCDDVGGAALSILSKVEHLDADLIVTNATLGVEAQGANQDDINIRINGKDITEDGVLIVSTNSNFRIWPVLKECNAGNTTKSGIRVNSASATVELFDPDVTDADTQMVYGLFNETSGSIIKVRGSAKFTGASDTAVRATGKITEWPSETTLSGTNGPFTSMGNVSGAQTMIVTKQSTSGSNVILWERTLDDESAYLITVELTGKLSGSAQRAAYVISGVFYRDGGGIATIEGAVDVDVSVASGGFAGVYALQSSGASEVYLLVNSGGVATYDWKARVNVTAIS